jgi:catechol 2,3-dioxygenase-like lactoylglutathione lyase family enzyme
VNLRTTRLEEMVAWYGEVLGMRPGWRPDFRFPGAWLYIGDLAAVHLVAVDEEPPAPAALKMEHFALTATGLGDLLATLKARGEPARLLRIEGAGIIQVNVHDPDGNHIHVDFSTAEADALGV